MSEERDRRLKIRETLRVRQVYIPPVYDISGKIGPGAQMLNHYEATGELPENPDVIERLVMFSIEKGDMAEAWETADQLDTFHLTSIEMGRGPKGRVVLVRDDGTEVGS